jgi:hypothetical protein
MVTHAVHLRWLRLLLLVGSVGLPEHALQAPAAKRTAPRFESVRFCELLANLDRYAGKEVEFDAVMYEYRHGGDLVNLGPHCAEATLHGVGWTPALAYDYALPPPDGMAKSRMAALRSLIHEWRMQGPCHEISIPVRVKGKIDVLSERGPNDPRTPMSGYGNLPPAMVQIQDIEELR